jgi:ribonucleotide monophosphatase NagD (HAD superfamily)
VTPAPTTVRDLLGRYDGLLLDVYGVLMDARGPLPGAAELLAELEGNRPYAIVTNDASRSADTYAARFASHGITVPAARFVTSGSLLAGYTPIRGKRTCVLGTPDSCAYAEAGGATVVPLGAELDALAVCDDAGFPFLDGLEAALNAVIRAVEAGRRPALVLPNPDLVYPKGGGELGFTAGAIDRLVMIGDQLETDVAGARAAGVATALLEGVSRWEHARQAASITPDWLLDAL